MTIDELKSRAIEIRSKYNQLNQQHGKNAWTGKDYAMGMVGDVGDLMKLIMAKENMRDNKWGNDIDAQLGHEMSDILWSLSVLANHYDVDLEKEFMKTMDELDARIAGGEE